MLTLANHFDMPVGYSDHTIGRDVSIAAVALGACVIEKHFTLDSQMKGPDHAASTEPDDFRDLVNSIRNVELSLGNENKQPTFAERRISQVVKKRIVAKQKINVGDAFSEENICVKRNNIGMEANQWDKTIGKIATKQFRVDEPIIFTMGDLYDN